jgi:hypothetical protein
VPTISEETLVDTINQWRRDKQFIQKDNVQMEEVVKVIREYREEEKVKIERINYEHFIAPKNIVLIC